MADEEVVFQTSTGPVRIITAASLFDGHDAAINVMRRLIQSSGAEVIHLGHDQSAKAVVDCAIQEDAHGVALTSYQGGHIEYFTYIRQLLDEAGCQHVRIFGGGGGTITPPEIKTLHESGISKIYSPDDGRTMGLMGMIHHLMRIASEVDNISKERLSTLDGPVTPEDMAKVGLLLTMSECADEDLFKTTLEKCRSSNDDVPVIGFTGTGGAGKSSLLDELMLRILRDNPGKKICLLCVDPTRKRTGGALLGDRIRMNSLSNNDLFMRSLASRGSGSEISANLDRAIEVGTSYYYQVTAFDRGNKESAGSVGASDLALPLPELVEPITGQLASAQTVFSWRPVSGALSYRVIVTTSPTSGEISDMELTADTMAVFNGRTVSGGAQEMLESGEIYYWKVIASTRDGGVENSVSAIEDFKVR